MNMQELVAQIAALTTRVETLEKAQAQVRDRGPKSEKTMTEAHAYSVKFGEHKDSSHKAAAAALGLSYGQVFSCRGGYTFKQVNKDWKPAAVEAPVTETEAQ